MNVIDLDAGSVLQRGEVLGLQPERQTDTEVSFAIYDQKKKKMRKDDDDDGGGGGSGGSDPHYDYDRHDHDHHRHLSLLAAEVGSN